MRHSAARILGDLADGAVIAVAPEADADLIAEDKVRPFLWRGRLAVMTFRPCQRRINGLPSLGRLPNVHNNKLRVGQSMRQPVALALRGYRRQIFSGF
jgi:hypothetical protein